MNFITYIEPSDPRPNDFSVSTIKRAIGALQGELDAWMRAAGELGFSPTDADEVCAAFAASHEDIFLAATELKFRYAMPVDVVGARVLFRVAEALPFARRLETHEWVMRNQLRVPAHDGDVIHFCNQDAARFSGHVLAVNRSNFSVVVERHSDNEAVSVPSENIFANLTLDVRGDEAERRERLALLSAVVVCERPDSGKKLVKFMKPTPPAPISPLVA